MALAVAVLCFAVSMRHTISMMVNGCGYLARTAFGFPIAVLFTAVAARLPAGLLPAWAVPLWVAAAETIVIAVLLSDASRILRQISGGR